MEEAEECPEPGTPRSAHTVSSAGGGSLRSFSLDESQNQRLLSHRKEVVTKLRQQLQSRDEMILDMQQQLAAQEHFTRESRSIVAELEEQLKQALDVGQKLGMENQKMAEKRERLEKELEEERRERARLAKENGRLNESVMELEQEDDRYALELEGAVKNLEQEKGKLEAAVKNLEQERGKLEAAVKNLEQERDGLRSTIDEQRGGLQNLEQEREQLQHTLQEREKALSDAESRSKSSGNRTQQEDVGPKLQALVAEKERLVQELEGAKQESTANATREKAASEKIEAVEKDLARFQKMLKGKDRLLEGYEKERTHLTAVLKVRHLSSAFCSFITSMFVCLSTGHRIDSLFDKPECLSLQSIVLEGIICWLLDASYHITATLEPPLDSVFLVKCVVIVRSASGNKASLFTVSKIRHRPFSKHLQRKMHFSCFRLYFEAFCPPNCNLMSERPTSRNFSGASQMFSSLTESPGSHAF
jgi:predicted  nucleic acid-binding Zn-ribbon protein